MGPNRNLAKKEKRGRLVPSFKTWSTLFSTHLRRAPHRADSWRIGAGLLLLLAQICWFSLDNAFPSFFGQRF